MANERVNSNYIAGKALYRGADKSLARPERKKLQRQKILSILFIIIIGGVLVLFIYITRLASNEIFSPSNKIHREVGRAKDLPAPLYIYIYTGVLISP